MSGGTAHCGNRRNRTFMIKVEQTLKHEGRSKENIKEELKITYF